MRKQDSIYLMRARLPVNWMEFRAGLAWFSGLCGGPVRRLAAVLALVSARALAEVLGELPAEIKRRGEAHVVGHFFHASPGHRQQPGGLAHAQLQDIRDHRVARLRFEAVREARRRKTRALGQVFDTVRLSQIRDEMLHDPANRRREPAFAMRQRSLARGQKDQFLKPVQRQFGQVRPAAGARGRGVAVRTQERLFDPRESRLVADGQAR